MLHIFLNLIKLFFQRSFLFYSRLASDVASDDKVISALAASVLVWFKQSLITSTVVSMLTGLPREM